MFIACSANGACCVAAGSPVMDIWNAGQPSQQGGEGDEASSRPTGPEELTSQLPVHMVVPGGSQKLLDGCSQPAAVEAVVCKV